MILTVGPWWSMLGALPPLPFLVGESPADYLLGGAGLSGWGLALYFLWAFITDRIVSAKASTQWRDLYLAEAKQKEDLLATVKAMETPLLALAEGVKNTSAARDVDHAAMLAVKDELATVRAQLVEMTRQSRARRTP